MPNVPETTETSARVITARPKVPSRTGLASLIRRSSAAANSANQGADLLNTDKPEKASVDRG